MRVLTEPIVTVSVVLFLLLGAIVLQAIWLSVFARTARQLLRSWPEAKISFVGHGRWIAFSERFGLPWIVALLVAPFVWIAITINVLPDTELGAWALFGPALGLMIAGVALGTLRVLRLIADA